MSNKKDCPTNLTAANNKKVRFKCNEGIKDVSICFKVFIPLHAITKRKFEYLKNALKITRKASVGQSGKI